MSASDRLLWYECNEVYAKFRSGALTKETGSKEMTKAVMEWEKNKASEERAFRINEQLARLYAEVEMEADAFRKEPCVETAGKFMEQLYGMAMNYKKTDRKEGDEPEKR